MSLERVIHPIYSGAVFAALGWALPASGILTLGYAAPLLVFVDVKSRRQDRRPEENYSGYGKYRMQASKLITFVY